MVRISEEIMIAELLIRLGAAYPDTTDEDITGCVRRAQEHFQSSPIREFVPLLVERRARAELARPIVGV
ncbi:three-helix bundle dimerization domain-containing protein [Mycobacterium sp. 134]|uniref:three-helix bundle dimerization domain-containing protein n=1 Tax=Mycobacterium sp. 134 TaxID=3400425 RepID=UPI003AABB6CE